MEIVMALLGIWLFFQLLPIVFTAVVFLISGIFYILGGAE